MCQCSWPYHTGFSFPMILPLVPPYPAANLSPQAECLAVVLTVCFFAGWAECCLHVEKASDFGTSCWGLCRDSTPALQDQPGSGGWQPSRKVSGTWRVRPGMLLIFSEGVLLTCHHHTVMVESVIDSSVGRIRKVHCYTEKLLSWVKYLVLAKTQLKD